MDTRPLILMLTEPVFAEYSEEILMLCSLLDMADFHICRYTYCEHCPVEVKLHKAIEVIHPTVEPLRGLRERNWEEISL